ncbi:MAG TPA: hypothetical protein VKM93_04155 [Terriglobia bacterium]|nr:hypothetical protein [Terriglobia bacterium]
MKEVKKLKHLSEPDLILYHYGEAGGSSRAVVAEHMSVCGPCRALYRNLQAVLAAADVVEVPARSEAYEAEVWQRLAPRLAVASPEGAWQRFVEHFRGRVWTPQVWAPVGGVAAVAVLVVTAFLAGRFWPGKPQPQPQNQAQAVSAQGRDRVLLVAVGDHLERSQMVLVELVNTNPQRTVDISAERERATDLVAANRLYRLTAERSGETGVADVLDELERTLIEIANSPSKLSSPEFEDLRRRIEAQGILFKVRVVDSQIHAREKKAIENVAKKSS